MPTLEDDRLVFRFPQVEEDASLSIDFQRTLRIPDSDREYPLPPGFGRFPLRHVEDFAGRLSAETATRGGVVLPIWQAEALWLHFANRGPSPDWEHRHDEVLRFPVAIKVAAGKVNAVTGDPWRPGLHRGPQDYMVSPEQPWLDGFAVAPGVVRQFVAMPLGEGWSAEEQLTGRAEWGGLQIAVMPLKREVWSRVRREWEARQRERAVWICQRRSDCADTMGLAPGGRMRQAIHRDPFDLGDWDVAAAQRVFVSLAPAEQWKAITGEAAPTHPPRAADYARAGLPWFDWLAANPAPAPTGRRLSRLKSLGALFKAKTGAPLPDSQDVDVQPTLPLGPGRRRRPVRTSTAWE